MISKPRRNAVLAGGLCATVVIAGFVFDPVGSVGLMRARVYDQLLVIAAPNPPKARVVVIDIDNASIERDGPWPWRREHIARLIETVRNAGAAAIGVDILFAAPDSQSPAALARKLAEVSGDKRAWALGANLTDDDSRLAEALASGGVALAFALDSASGGDAPTTPTLARAAVDLGEIWSGAGGVYPIPQLAKSAALGLSSLPGDADGVVRRAPLFAAIGPSLKPSLALETVRLARHAQVYVLEASPARAMAGDVSVALPRDAMLRLVPSPMGVTTISAMHALGSDAALDLKGAIVFIGASAPQAGGLRATGDSPLTASVAIQARVAEQILSGFAPIETDPRLTWGIAAAISAGLALLTAYASAPLAYAVAALAIFAPFGVAVAAASCALLFDPVEVSAPAFAGFVAAAGVMGASRRRRARRLRERFERHLAPAIVRRIIANDHQPKLAGERREITALFTDIEGFTSMVSRTEPEALVGALDAYFDGVTRIGFAHGGMVDKFVGDAAHLFFNMPFDLADHPTRALDCAEEIVRWSEAFRREPGPAAMGFGRTRVGLESGPALVGDVGGGAKLDYTAHGETVNVAARLEQENKLIGTAICIGPGAAARIAVDRLRPVGKVQLRGFPNPLDVYAPWPEQAPASWRTRYAEAWTQRAACPGKAAATFATLAAEQNDPVAARESRA